MSVRSRIMTPTRVRNSTRGFTLIELLIVVAIIAVLAAIAVPNFLEAQVRAKVSRAKSDMRTIATGLEQYAVDYNGYPDIFTRIRVITTPIQYLSALPTDPFRSHRARGNRPWRRGWYRYGAMPLDKASRYVVASVGPDTDIDTYLNATADTEDTDNWEPNNQALRLYPGYSPALFSDEGASVNEAVFKYIPYDPTNGTISDGDIFRLHDHQSQ